MANVTTIAIDPVAGTSTLTIVNAGNNVEIITYIDAKKVLTFASRPLINLSALDFLNYLHQFVIFQQVILNNFNANIFSMTPFTQMISSQDNNITANSWDYYCLCGYTSSSYRIVDYSALGSAKTVNLNNRQSTVTAYFAEWVNLLNSLQYYSSSVKQFFSL